MYTYATQNEMLPFISTKTKSHKLSTETSFQREIYELQRIVQSPNQFSTWSIQVFSNDLF